LREGAAIEPDPESDLSVRELFRLQRQRRLSLTGCRLLTLSACSVGRAGAVGDDFQGFLAAVASLGCPNTIAALWSVDDKSTSKLMQDLYAQLKQGLPLASALRRAALNIRCANPDGSRSHPFFWAAFQLYGSG
jgi:CHAT domain-containing protein